MMDSDKIKLKSVMKIGSQAKIDWSKSVDKKKLKEDGSVYILTPTFETSKSDIEKGHVQISPSKTQIIDIIQPTCNKNPSEYQLEKERPRDNLTPIFPGYGIVITLISSMFFSVSVACVKGAVEGQPGMDGITLAFFRGSIICFITGFIQLSRGENLYVPRSEIIVNILRSLFGSAAVFGLYISMKYISLGDATAISFSSPVWTYILSYLILKENLNWIQIVSLPASIFGVLLIANPYLFIEGPDVGQITTEQLLNDGLLYPNLPLNLTTTGTSNLMMTTTQIPINVASLNTLSTTTTMPTDNPSLKSLLLDTHYSNETILAEDNSGSNSLVSSSDKIYGTIMALVGSLSMSGTFIVLKFRKKTPVQTTIFWFGLTTSTIALTIMTTYSGYVVPSSLKVWLLILGNGVLSFVGQAFFQIAFFYEDASIIALIKTVEVVMAFIISMIFLDDYIEWTSIIGALIIVTSVASLMLLKWYKSMK